MAIGYSSQVIASELVQRRPAVDKQLFASKHQNAGGNDKDPVNREA